MEEIAIVLEACCCVWLAWQYKRASDMNERMSEIAAKLLYFLSKKGLLGEYEKFLMEERNGEFKELLSESQGHHGNHED